LDARDFRTLAFSATGPTLGSLEVGLRDSEGHERKVVLGSAIMTGSCGRVDVELPLASFGEVSLGSLQNVSFAFSGARDSAIVAIDDVRFSRHLRSFLVNDFDRDNKVNALGGEERIFTSGNAAIASRIASQPSGGMLCLSYGGSIGEITSDHEFSYAGWATELNGVDVHDTKTLCLRIRGNAGETLPRVYLDDGGFRWGVNIRDYVAPTTEAWQDVTIPLTAFAEAGVDLSHIEEFQLVFEWEDVSGVFCVDAISFGSKTLVAFTEK
jgi:hypothetical protein